MQIDAGAVRTLLEEIIADDVLARLVDGESFRDQGVDSLDVVTLLLALEERFELVVPDADVPLCSSVDAIVAYAEGRDN
jgi:acyl carrier protein